MKYAWLVAMREFAENVKTKGFWIGILLFPLILVASIQVPKFLAERATPTRNFLLIDQSGEFDDIVEKAVERRYAGQVAKAFGEYVQKHGKIDQAKNVDLEKVKASALQFDPEALMSGAGLPSDQIDVLAESGGIDLMTEQVAKLGLLKDDAPPFEKPRKLLRRVAALPEGVDPKATPDEIKEALKPYLIGDRKISVDGDPGKLFAAVIITEDAPDRVTKPGLLAAKKSVQANSGKSMRGVQYLSTNLTDNDLKNAIERAINKEIRRREYEAEDVDTKLVKRIQGTRIAFFTLNPKKKEGEQEVSLADTLRQWAPVGFVYLLFVALMTVAQMLLNNTVEEKSNRIIEVLLSSVTPRELMTGKLLGIACVGLLMMTAWVISILGVFHFMSSPETKWAGTLFDVVTSSGLIYYFVVYFVLGYLLYAGIFLAIGSLCNTLKEAQNFMGPVMLIMMVPLLTMAFIPKDPNGTLATILTWIPLYTPFVMMNRAAADPPMFDLVGSGVLLVLSIVFVLWASAKVFRLAILRTGQPPKFLELFRWLRD